MPAKKKQCNFDRPNILGPVEGQAKSHLKDSDSTLYFCVVVVSHTNHSFDIEKQIVIFSPDSEIEHSMQLMYNTCP